jgi:hypothetical protein
LVLNWPAGAAYSRLAGFLLDEAWLAALVAVTPNAHLQVGTQRTIGYFTAGVL